MSKDCCPSCHKPWVDHLGIQGTCAQLTTAESALKVIHTWATYQDGFYMEPTRVAALCEKVLKEK